MKKIYSKEMTNCFSRFVRILDNSMNKGVYETCDDMLVMADTRLFFESKFYLLKPTSNTGT